MSVGATTSMVMASGEGAVPARTSMRSRVDESLVPARKVTRYDLPPSSRMGGSRSQSSMARVMSYRTFTQPP